MTNIKQRLRQRIILRQIRGAVLPCDTIAHRFAQNKFNGIRIPGLFNITNLRHFLLLFVVNIITLLRRARSQPQRAKAYAYHNAKSFLYKSWPDVAEFIAKNSEQAYTPALTCPPLRR